MMQSRSESTTNLVDHSCPEKGLSMDTLRMLRGARRNVCLCVPVSNSGFYNNAEGNPGSSGAPGSSGCDVPIVSPLLCDLPA